MLVISKIAAENPGLIVLTVCLAGLCIMWICSGRRPRAKAILVLILPAFGVIGSIFFLFKMYGSPVWIFGFVGLAMALFASCGICAGFWENRNGDFDE